jgi:hypothetical protein
MWSKIYLIGRRIDEILVIVKKSDELPEIETVETPQAEAPSS